MTDKPLLPEDLVAEIDRLAPQLMFLDHYAVLGVDEGASEAEIKTAYLRVIKRFHPDRWHARDSGSHRKRMEAIFARATEAYEVLRSPASKLDYDRSLAEIRGIARPSSKPVAARAAVAAPLDLPLPPPRAAPPPPPPRRPTPPTAARAPSVTELAKAVRLMEQLRPTQAPASRTAVPIPAPASAPTPPPVAAPAPAPSPNNGISIVVVEDDDTLRKMLVRIFSELGSVREARDGRDALTVLAQDPVPRLVVTDVMMPNMDGLELARRMKADPRLSRVPILMLTARQGPRDLIDGVNAGARVYVTKPFKVDDLKAKAKKAMGT